MSKGKHEHDLPPEIATGATPPGEDAGDAAPGRRAEGDRPKGEREQVRNLETEVRSLREQLEAAVAERDANKDKWLRAEAERENYRKRVQRDIDDLRQYQALPLVRDLLPGLDNLQRAIAAAAGSGRIEDLIMGVEMIARQLEDVLARYGVKPIEAVGEPFDPHLHEAVQYVASPGTPAMTVVDEAERGYVLHDRVVRPSKVVVSSGPPEPPSADQPAEDGPS